MTPTEPPVRYAAGHVLAARFRIVRFLGRGGMGEVYEAADLDLHQHIALKLIRPESRTDPKLLSRLREEVRQARSVSHSNVCRVYDLERDEASGAVFITMELLRGETLSARLRRSGCFQAEEALPVLRQIAEGMDAIHARRILHLDFKPANVMLEFNDTEMLRAVVTDFGLAKSLSPLSSVESTISLVDCNGGTPDYMAPERFSSSSPLTPAADVYAFGLVVYEMLLGSRRGGQPGVLPPSLRTLVPSAPPEWEEMVKGCFAARPEDRFLSCGAAIRSLAGGRESQRVSARSAGGRYWRFLAAAIIALLAVAFFVFRPTGTGAASSAALRWYDQGVDAIREGTYYKAVRALEQSLKESPDYLPTHASLAEAWLELDSPERASEEMLLASETDSSGKRIGARRRERIQAIHDTVTRDFTKASADYMRLAQSASASERPRAEVDLGRALERSKEPRKALEQYQDAVNLDPNYAGAWLRLAVVSGQLQQSGKMADALRRAESLYEASSDLEGLTEVYYQRGTYANKQTRLGDAAEWLERARQSALATRNPHQQIRALYQLSAVAYQKGDTVAAQKLAEEAVQEARASNIEFLAGRGYLDLGNAMATRGNFEKATEYFNELLRIARNYHSGKLEATALYSLGDVANRTRVDEAGAHQVEQALAWFEANGYPGEASYCLVVLGRFQRNRGDLAAASAAFNKQLEIAQASHDELQTAVALSSVASILIRQERFPEALDLTLKQVAISKRMGDGLRVAYGQETLAQIYADLGRFEESAASAQEAEASARQNHLEELQVNVAVTKAEAELLRGRASEAATLADQGVRAYEGKYARQAGELLGILATARKGSPFQTRWAWCERGLKLVEGSVGAELSLRLTEAELLLEAKNPQGALKICPQARSSFERQQSEYSLFRTELIAARAYRYLGRKDDGAAERATAAIKRFQGRFSSAEWERFRSRSDFQVSENFLRELRF
jgi:serine/threonine protein kinase